MVNDRGQLFTIEGIAAGMIIILTAYFVFNATSVYTAGDAHITDMQMEVLGSDALKMMNTASNSSVAKNPLQMIIERDDGERFRDLFMNYTNNRTSGKADTIQFTANYTYRVEMAGLENTSVSSPLSYSRNLTGGEHAVKVTQWVVVEKKIGTGAVHNRAVLVEVLMWRD
jgi:hypothetical protein